MFYYKNLDGSFQTSEIRLNSDMLEEITEAEYDSILPVAENEPDEKDVRIAELEKENAALLYELLTGEEFVE